MARSKIIIFGPLPPPVGGVSVFVQRRSAFLTRSGVSHQVIDWARTGLVSRMRWLAYLLAWPKPSTSIEINDLLTLPMVALVLRPFRSNIVFRIHSGRFANRLTGARRQIFTRFLMKVNDCVVVGPHVAIRLRDAGFSIPTSTRVESAFLPPDTANEEQYWAEYGSALHGFAAEHKPLLVMQGSDGLDDGIDRYGSDVAIDALAVLKQKAPNVGLIIGRPSIGDLAFQDYTQGLADRTREAGLTNDVFVLEGEKCLWPLIRRGDVFLRPTTTDGDSVSVREAMYFGTPVIASNAVPRPDGVVLFKNRDADDLARQTLNVLGLTHDSLSPISD